MKAFENDLVLEGDRIIEHKPAISDKALRLNLNKNIYGTFSEIGAGQETVRHFSEPEDLQEPLPKQCLPMINNLVMLYIR